MNFSKRKLNYIVVTVRRRKLKTTNQQKITKYRKKISGINCSTHNTIYRTNRVIHTMSKQQMKTKNKNINQNYVEKITTTTIVNVKPRIKDNSKIVHR